MDFIFFRGLPRSGNHLVINWIIHHYSNAYFSNNCVLKYDYRQEDLFAKFDAVIAKDHDCVIFSAEFFTHLTDLDEIFSYAKKVFNTEIIFSPVLIRDPLNWMASTLCKFTSDPETLINKYDKLQDGLWKLWLEAYAIKQEQINFNSFVSSDSYRNDFAKTLGRKFDKAADDKVMNTLWDYPDIVPRSSFDTELVDLGKIQPKEMKVLERYRVLSCLPKNSIPDDILKISKECWGYEV